MEMGRRILNIAFTLFGIIVVFVSLRLVLRHQYALLRHRFLTDEPRIWVPTIVPLLLGIWIFLVGLVGLIDERRSRNLKLHK